MNDDQSFYEIQLNTAHLGLAVLGAAVVGVALFWLGVIIGNGQGATAAPSDWQAAVPVDQSEDDAGNEDAELFGESGASNPAIPADDPATDDATSSAPEATTDPPANAVTEDPETDPPVDEESFQPADPVDEQPAPVVASSETGLPQADATLSSGWVVQVRSTPDEASANTLQQTLAGAGFPAFVISADVDGTTYYRVRVGRYGSRADADVVEAALMQRGDIEDAWVTEG